jgi:hypothetical protein
MSVYGVTLLGSTVSLFGFLPNWLILVIAGVLPLRFIFVCLWHEPSGFHDGRVGLRCFGLIALTEIVRSLRVHSVSLWHDSVRFLVVCN